MVAVPAGSGLLYWGCRVTAVVLMSLRSRPAPTRALITACWRSLVWFIADVTSGAVNSIPTSAVRVSGTPCTWPDPSTVTWRGFTPGAGAALCLSHPDTAARTRPDAATAIDQRANLLAFRAIDMPGTLARPEC